MSKRSFVALLGLLAGSWPASAAESPQKSEDKAPAVQGTRHTRVRLGGISVGAGYARYSGWPYLPAYWAYSPFLYDPYFYYPYFYHPYYAGGFARGANMGEVKLRTEVQRAEVFLDGAYAGTAADLKSMWLDPGAYNLEIKADNRAPFSRRIYVLSGKTLKIDARLKPENSEKKP